MDWEGNLLVTRHYSGRQIFLYGVLPLAVVAILFFAGAFFLA